MTRKMLCNVLFPIQFYTCPGNFHLITCSYYLSYYRLPIKVVDVPFPSVFKEHLDNALNNMFQILVSPEGLRQLDFVVPLQQNCSILLHLIHSVGSYHIVTMVSSVQSMQHSSSVQNGPVVFDEFECVCF